MSLKTMPISSWLAGSVLSLLVLAAGSAAARPGAGAVPPVVGGSSGGGGAALLSRVSRALAGSDLAGAQKLLTEAYLADPQPALLCWLGRVASRRAGAGPDRVRSQDYFRRCVSAGRPPADPELWQEAQAAAGASQPQVELQIIDSEGSFLWLDDQLLGQAPLDRPVLTTAGPHVLKRVHRGDVHRQDLSLSRDQPVYLTWLSSGGWDTAFMDMFVVLLPAPGPSSEASSASLFPAIEAALEKGNAISILPPVGSSGAATAATACRGESSCLIQRAKAAQVPFALEILIDKKANNSRDAKFVNDYKIDVYAVDARVGKPMYQGAQDCAGCSPQALQQKVIALALDARRRALRGVGSLDVVSQPPAQLNVDGEPRGRTPLQLTLYTGPHTLSLSHRHFYPLTQSVEIRESKPTRVLLQPQPLPLSRGEKAVRVGKWVLGVAGLVQLAVAIPLLLLPEPVVADSNPLAVVATHDIGTVGVTSGAICLAAGAILFGIDAARSDRRHAPW